MDKYKILQKALYYLNEEISPLEQGYLNFGVKRAVSLDQYIYNDDEVYNLFKIPATTIKIILAVHTDNFTFYYREKITDNSSFITVFDTEDMKYTRFFISNNTLAYEKRLSNLEDYCKIINEDFTDLTLHYIIDTYQFTKA